MTVLGPVAASDLGVTLPHEHLLLNWFRVTGNRDHLLAEHELAMSELEPFTAAGGRTVVEVTNRNVGRNPLGLQRIARETGLNVVMACGWMREPFFDPEVYQRSTNALADDIIRDIQDGVDGTGIRAGIIGEIGCDKDYISPAEERSYRAAARAHCQTGLTVTTHSLHWPAGPAQLEILREEGVAPGRVIIGHCDSYPEPDYHAAIAAAGAWVQFDLIRGVVEWEVQKRIRLIKEMIGRGYVRRLLLSQDICMQSQTRAFGGTGYAFILTGLVPRLLAAGVTEEHIRVLTIDNPRAALTGLE
jgi:predicted metal-dependent phosphotriesterase family hydrolase